MPILRLDHVQLAMPPGREPEARAFYGGLLGLPEVAKPAALAGRGGCWFERGPVKVHLGVETGFAPARKAHPAFLVDDLLDLATRLEQAGYAVRDDAPLEGHTRGFVDDPFGNRIELLQPTIPFERLTVTSGYAYEDTFGYARAVRVGRQVFVSGTTARGPELDQEAGVQAAAIIALVATALAEAGAELRHVVRTVVYLVDMADADAVARAHREAFGRSRPASTLVAVAALTPPGARVEIEATAVLHDEA